MGDPIDMKSLIKALLIVTATVAVTSAPVIPETCLACKRRVCPVGIAKPLRMMNVTEWVMDTAGDLHLNGICPTFYTMIDKDN